MEGEPSHSESAPPGNKEKLSESQRKIQNFWPTVTREMQQLRQVEPGNQLLPLARIKKIMKLDEDVKMISSDAPLLFAKAIEIFIHELTLRAWLHTEQNKRRTLQRSDIAMAITKYDQFDFLIDIVPREEIKLTKRSYDVRVSPSGGIENVQYYLQLAQQHQQVLTQQQEQQPEHQNQEQHQEANQEQQSQQQQVVTVGSVAATPVKAVAMPAVIGLNSVTSTPTAPKTITTATASAAAITANTANTIVQLKQANLQQTSKQQKPLQGLQAISFLNTSAVAGSSGSSSGSTTSTAATIPTINQPLQLVQHFLTPTGEITQIPITIPQNQLNFIRTAVPMAGATGATGTTSVQPIFLPAAAALQTPTFIHTPPGCMYFSASQLQQFQQQQQQQQQQRD
ncbi:hypothetical protein AND_004110 [Anopheles darlingi]|uniref:Nuclear transcription factor Y subunit gamma n=1 Tax=Anopheles darlingi TaxID=43151 RepID=W5JJ39_ANODA|nr:hypothetical protein AND_004110 [Anopheles darlingi]